ncbi:MAG: cbb3-type cytochrome oxidase assembly protein CcoS [Planctomycetota bacterium]
MTPVLAMSVIWWIFAVCLVMGLGAWLVFTWSIKSGQYDDVERAARDLLEQDAQDTISAADLAAHEARLARERAAR